MLSLPRLFLLAQLHRSGTMSAVARAQSMSPSAVPQQLAQLERETRVSLLQNAGRGVALTDAGVQLARRAQEMLALAESAQAELSASRGDTAGVLRIASFQTPMIALAPVAVSVLEQRHPRLRAEIAQREVDAAYEGLLAHHFDMILGEDYPGGAQVVRSGTDREGLLRDPLLLVLPPHGPWADGRTRPRSATSPACPGPWTRGHPHRHLGADLPAHPRDRTVGALRHPRPAAAGASGALRARGRLRPGLIAAEQLGGTRPVRLPGDPHRSLYTAVRAGAREHPALQAFRAALLEAAGSLADLEGIDPLGG